MLNCKKTSELASRALDSKLSFWENAALKTHLFLCRKCENFRQQLIFLRKASRHAQSSHDFRLSDEAKQRITKVLKDKKTSQ